MNLPAGAIGPNQRFILLAAPLAGAREDLVRQVRITVLHEIGHHFGMSEEDLERLGYR